MSVRDLFIEAAEETREQTGASVSITVSKPLVMRLVYPDGVAFSTHGTKVPLNSRTTAAILKDKRLTVAELHRMGIATPRTHFIDPHGEKPGSTKIRDKIEHFVHEVGGYPIFIKPNSGSQGKDVFRVDSADELDKILARVIARKSNHFIAQEACAGEEYRVVAIGGEVELAIRKQPLSITGDGIHTVKSLIDERLIDLRVQGRHITIKPNSPKIESHLGKQGISLKDIIEEGREIIVLANKNLSDGASPVVCTDFARARYTATCIRIQEEMGVEFAGYDFIEDARRGTAVPKILEINGAPGFDHFANTGANHPDLVRDVFRAAFQRAHDLHLAQRQARTRKSNPIPSDGLNAV